MAVTTSTRQRLAAALTSQSAAAEILDGLDASGSMSQFDITAVSYGASVDAADNSTAIGLAFTAAQAYTAANPGEWAEVRVPEGIYNTDSFILTGDRLRIAGEGTLKWLSSNTTSAAFIDATGDDIEVEGVTLDCNNAGLSTAGHAVRLWGQRNYVARVTAKNSLDTAFQAHDGSRYTLFTDCVSDGCKRAFRVRGDYVKYNQCQFLNFFGDKGGTVDPVDYDTQYFGMKDCHFKTDAATWELHMLIDPGDNIGVTCGVATNVGGKARYTIAGGHGYKPGDGFLIADSTIGSWDRVHKITATNGELFVKVLSTTTLSLHTSAATAYSGAAKISLTTTGTGTQFYISTPRGGRRTVLMGASGGVDTTNSILTTTATHGFQTGEEVRIAYATVTDTLPGGILTAGQITLNTDYVSAGSASTTYTRPHRIEQVVLENLTFEAPNASLNAGNLIKVNNTNYCSITNGSFYNSLDDSASGGDSDILSIRFGGNNRMVCLRNVRMTNGLFHNTSSNITRLLAEQCVFGDHYIQGLYAIEGLQAQHSIFRQCVFRSNIAAIEYDYNDDDLEYMEFDDNTFEGFDSDDRISILRASGNYTRQLVTGGKIFFKRNNSRRNVRWAGSAATFTNSNDVVTLTDHCMNTGDDIYFTGGSLPVNVVANTVYYLRVTGNSTFTLHTTKAASTLAGATPLNFGADGSGTGFNYKLGYKLIRINVADDVLEPSVLLRCRESEFDLEDWGKTNAAYSGLFMPLGLKVWNMNPGLGQPLGWMVTEASTPATTVATLSNLPFLSDVLVANVAEDGNDGSGEDTLLSYTLPADTLYTTGCSLEIEAGFSFANNTAAKQVKVYLGGNQIYASGSSAHQGGGMCFKAVVVRDAVNTAKISVSVTTSGSNTPFPIAFGNGFNQGSVDWSTALTISGTGEATSNNDIVMEFLRVKVSTASAA